MSVEIWPPIAPDQLKAAVNAAEKRELDWFVDELRETLTNLRHGLEDCYALLAPIDPGSTLVLSTPRNEAVKGHVTRVGTRIVKGTIHLRLHTLPQQTLTINPDHPIHLAPLTTLHSLLTHSVDLLALTLSYSYPSDTPTVPTTPDIPPPQFLSAQLRLLSQSLSEASALLKGAPLMAPDPTWTTCSVSPTHFLPPFAHPHAAAGHPSLSFHLSIQDSSLVLWLRALEPADAPVNFGTKFALAIGTARRLEHDETEKVFGYCCNTTVPPGSGEDLTHAYTHPHPFPHHPPYNQQQQQQERRASASVAASLQLAQPAAPIALSGAKQKTVDVFVREKVRVESADPSLLSLSAKLMALGHTLGLARRNLAAVMGEEMED
ncbi:RAVE subunit 2/Rogdi [Staphylotrichum tortipilum]|uniref:RAVE subunit 2/Rogdi n=1 Tax=Staphylotrichum tortipilum TaxID=2831512 RepID=A0AAN6MAU7_9PEZI|nr:RAVE subunit 2/Rogdi [Staphylotrichum longicolle]